MNTILPATKPLLQLLHSNTATALCVINQNTTNGYASGIKKMQKAWLMVSLILLMILPGMAWGQTATLFLQSTQTQSGTSTYVRDLSETQGTTGTVISNTSNGNTTYLETLAFTRNISNLTNAISENSFPVSIDINTASSNNTNVRFRIQRVNSSGAVQASSGYSTVFTLSTYGTKTATLSFTTAQTWQSTDLIRLSIEVARSSGTGSGRTITVNTGDAQSFVQFTYTPAYLAQFISMSTGSATWCAGETRNVTVTVKNVGTAAWADLDGKDFNVGVKWNTNGANWTDYHVRTDVQNLAPGATGTFTLPITASNNIGAGYTTPLAAGTNNLIFDIVYEAVSWFGNNGGGVGPGNSVYTSSPITINDAPSQPTATGTTICNNSTATLTASGAVSGDKYKWYDAASGGTLLKTSLNNTDNTFTTLPLTATTNYWVAILTSAGCESARVQVTATVSNPVATVGATKNISCYNGTDGEITVSASGGDGVYQFSVYNGNSGTWVDENLPDACKFSGLVANTQYKIRVKDSNNCTSPIIP